MKERQQRHCPYCDETPIPDEQPWIIENNIKKKTIKYFCGTILELELKTNIYRGRYLNQCRFKDLPKEQYEPNPLFVDEKPETNTYHKLRTN